MLVYVNVCKHEARMNNIKNCRYSLMLIVDPGYQLSIDCIDSPKSGPSKDVVNVHLLI